ncbi:methyltransferase domain-containing protein [Kribbella speibonae]|uniref:Methyltransferase domain-containing protein n=2 Tax=Kribbella speibonae TaxID=1572660 RepID=A0A4V2M394_9ACTN|nr:methyltransferase domain-containing protein [Kribbella speibonae]TCC31092.1 methyltransferase domain-containing protein [Kribbella speibonae]
MQLSIGFWSFKALATADELGLFARLSGTDGRTVDELAKLLDLDQRPTEMLVTACASLGLLERRDGRYVNSELAEAFLVPGKDHHFGGWVQMLDRRLYPAWGKLTDAVRTNRPTSWNPDEQPHLFASEDPELLALFWEAMHSLSTLTARELGVHVDLSDSTALLDVGGGSGAYDIELCRRYPNLRATVFDLPPVCDIAAGKLKAAGYEDRITVAPGDFLTDPELPAGHDVVLLSMIMHDWAPEQNLEILRKCFAALPSGGRIVISELLVNDEKTGPPAATLMSLNMLVETVGGRNYTAAEYEHWLRTAGFQNPQTTTFEAPGANGAVTAQKP